MYSNPTPRDRKNTLLCQDSSVFSPTGPTEQTHLLHFSFVEMEGHLPPRRGAVSFPSAVFIKSSECSDKSTLS